VPLSRDGALAAVAQPSVGGPVGTRSPLPPLLLLSRHHGLVSGLAATHAAFAPTARLAKRWLGTQLMLGPTQVSALLLLLLLLLLLQKYKYATQCNLPLCHKLCHELCYPRALPCPTLLAPPTGL
jgi:hypothetical protein